ncbi:hypothetical protein [Shewanella algae]|uniref:hypothetical protein n=1 Tax=Shewanella algae TaxID=38313 RepID=UPI0031F55E38
MMSVEEQLSNAVQACNNLAAAVNGKIQQIDQKVDAATTEIEDKFLSLSRKVYYVDGILGVDTNDGLSTGKALKTLSKAYEKCKNDSASLNEIYIVRNGEYALPFDASGSVLTDKIAIRASGDATANYPDDLGVTIKITGSYAQTFTSHEFSFCNIVVESTSHGFLCADGIKVRTYRCKVIKGSSLNYFIGNYSNPAGLNYATFQETTFDGAGATFYPVGKLSGTTFWKQVAVTLANSAAMNPSYTSLSDLYVY